MSPSSSTSARPISLVWTPFTMMSGRTKPNVMPPFWGVMSAAATPAWSGAACAAGASAATIRPATRPASFERIAVLQP